MTTISPATSQISPASERVYHQSNLLGDWKGTWANTSRPVEFKVINIRGDKAQIEYTHDGHTERGLADVNGATITFGNVTIATRNGSAAAFEFSVGDAKKTAILNKQAATTDQNKLVGTWNGFSTSNGKSASFTVKSVDGRDAVVSWSVDGVAHAGAGTVYKNTVMFGRAQVTSDDGKTGTVVLQVGSKSYAIPVTKYVPPSTSTTVNKLA
jgi:Ca2+-binding RTX toxin-like protein